MVWRERESSKNSFTNKAFTCLWVSTIASNRCRKRRRERWGKTEVKAKKLKQQSRATINSICFEYYTICLIRLLLCVCPTIATLRSPPPLALLFRVFGVSFSFCWLCTHVWLSSGQKLSQRDHNINSHSDIDTFTLFIQCVWAQGGIPVNFLLSPDSKHNKSYAYHCQCGFPLLNCIKLLCFGSQRIYVLLFVAMNERNVEICFSGAFFSLLFLSHLYLTNEERNTIGLLDFGWTHSNYTCIMKMLE